MSVHRSLIRSSARANWTCLNCRTILDRPLSGSVLSAPSQQCRSITQNHIRKIQIAEEEWSHRKADIEAGRRKSMLDVLEERGFVNQIVGTRDDLNKLLNEKRIGVYAGVDPTAPSLHVGHMVPFMALGWMYIHGYSATFLMGGFTAGVGDPIGRLTGRAAQSKATKTANSVAMFHQLKRLGASMERHATKRGYPREWAWRRSLKNNYEWWRKETVGNLMKVLGAGTRIGPMLGRDTVKNRLESGEGMSFSEFSYPLFQAWDWWQLYQQQVQLQIGGADQFGNILAGAEAVKYMAKNEPNWTHQNALPSIVKLRRVPDEVTRDPMGFTVPLLTTSSGEKFGKSAGNAVWLDPSMTSSFDLYQFFLRSADADVERYLKLFTFLSIGEIEEVMTKQREDESKRHAQHTLAAEFVELIHGEAAAKEAAQQHRQLFNKKLTLSDIQAHTQTAQETPLSSSPSAATSSSNNTIAKTADGRPIDMNPLVNKYAKPLDMHTGGDVQITLPHSLVVQQPLGRILWSAGLVASRSEGQRMISSKGVYLGGIHHKNHNVPMGDELNFAPVTDPKWSTVAQHVLEGSVLIVRTGKWRVKIIRIVPDEEYEASGRTCPGWKEDEKVQEKGEATANAEQQLKELDLYGEEFYRRADQEKAMDKAKAEEIARARKRYQATKSQQ